MIRAGALRHVLNIQFPVIEYGNAVGFANISGAYRLRCEFINGTTGKEKQGDSGTYDHNQHVIRCRYRADLTASHQLVDPARPDQVFKIVHLDNVKRENREYLITLEQITRG